MSIAAGRGWSAAGEGLGGIGQLLFGVAQRKQAEAQRLAEREAEWERGAPDRELSRAATMANANLMEGPRPQTPVFELGAPVGSGLIAAPTGEMQPHPDYEQFGNFHRLSPEARERQRIEQQQEVFSNAIGQFLTNREDPDAIGTLYAAGINPGTVRQATQPEPEPRWVPTTFDEHRAANAPYPETGGEDGMSSERLRQVGYQVNATKQGLAKLMQYEYTPQDVEDYVANIWGSMDAFREAERLVTGMGSPGAGPTREAAESRSVLFPGSPSFMDTVRSRGGGFNASGSTATTPLSATDKEKARTDPAFREWLTGNGYTEADWR